MARLPLVAGLVSLLLPAWALGGGSGTITFVAPATVGSPPAVESNGRGRRVPTGSMLRRNELWPHVHAAARAHGLDPELVDLVIRMESGYNPVAVSPKGARGVMQLLPGTARHYGVSDIFDPRDNINGGVRYLRDLLQRFGKDVKLALAAYNAGPETVERYGGVPPYRETRNYVETILASYNGIGLAKVTGGFGRPPEPATPVEVERGKSGVRISNASSPGEAKVRRRLSLQ